MLLERTAELAALRQRLAAAAAGHGHTVVISGEAGIGKSALTRAFLADPGMVAHSLRGACENLRIAEPLAPLHDLARQAGWSLPQSISDPGGRLAVFSEALIVLESQDRPTVLVIEDLHWADDATIDFLRFIGRRIETLRILLIVTSRDDDNFARGHIRRVTTAIPPDGQTRLRLEPLSLTAVATLSQDTGLDAAEVLRLTAGNAFFVTEILRSGTGGQLASVQDFVLERASTLAASARQVLELVSVVPGQAEIDLVTGLGAEPTGIDACIDSGLLESDGECLSFRHELARQAVEKALSDARRQNLNQAILKALEQKSGSSFGRLLHHAAASRDSGAINRYAPRAAADAESSGSLRQATEYYRLAIDNSARLPAAEKADLYRRFAYAAHHVALFGEAIAAQKTALELYQAIGDIESEGGSYRSLSRYYWLAGKRAEAKDYAEKAYQTLANHRGPELAMALSNFAQLDMLDFDYSKAPEYCRLAIEIAEEFNRPDIIAHAKNNLANVLGLSDPPLSIALIDESLQISLREKLWNDAARAHTNGAYMELSRLDFRQFHSRALAGLNYARATEQDGFRHYLAGTVAMALLHLGRWSEVDAFVAEVHQSGDVAINSSQTFPAASAHIWLALRRGYDPDPELLSYLDSFIADMDEMQRLAVYAEIQAEKAWLGLNDRQDALVILDRTLQKAKSLETVPIALFWLAKLGGRLERELPDLLAAPVRAALAGDWKLAAEGWAASGVPYFEALSLAEGDHADREKAVALLQGLGAEPALRKLAADWRAQGLATDVRIPRKSAHEHPSGLTRRQVDVLRALGDGLSNAEIATRLFIASKTVDHHVSAILALLDVGSRGEAAAKARQMGWL